MGYWRRPTRPAPIVNKLYAASEKFLYRSRRHGERLASLGSDRCRPMPPAEFGAFVQQRNRPMDRGDAKAAGIEAQ